MTTMSSNKNLPMMPATSFFGVKKSGSKKKIVITRSTHGLTVNTNDKAYIAARQQSPSRVEGMSPGLGVTTGPLMHRMNYIDHSGVNRTPAV